MLRACEIALLQLVMHTAVQPTMTGMVSTAAEFDASVGAELRRLGHGPRHETADDRLAVEIPRPDHGPPGPVRLGDDRVIRDHYPFSVEPNAIVTILHVPVDICERHPVGIRAAMDSMLALKAFEPGFEW